MPYALSTIAACLNQPFIMTWLEIRAIFYWIFLWWLLPRGIKALCTYGRESYIADQNMAYNLEGFRFVTMVHRGMGVYSPALTLRGSIAIWLATRGRVWKSPEALEQPDNC